MTESLTPADSGFVPYKGLYLNVWEAQLRSGQACGFSPAAENLDVADKTPKSRLALTRAVPFLYIARSRDGPRFAAFQFLA